MEFDPIITPRNLTFDNESEFGFELEMEKNTSSANKLRSNNIKKKIAILAKTKTALIRYIYSSQFWQLVSLKKLPFQILVPVLLAHILPRHPLSISASVISSSADLRSSSRSLPKMTACKHAMASTSNPEAVQIAHMTQRNFLQSAASLARTIQSRKTCSLFSNPSGTSSFIRQSFNS
ncbi:uncharacterized protein [Gossypium hirsutum]|uniref:Uncharacterized protein n=1 Tax=Gossypium hirsutum TaxID=3635 RepID=A0ABM2YHZ2_GOSHI|nr:uncharacterized protein LOC121203782 [Gossypium hirsutum]